MDYPRYLYIGQADENGNIPGVVVFSQDEEAARLVEGYRRDPQEKTTEPEKTAEPAKERRKPGRPRKP